MDLLQLEHFLAVVEERTFTRAAERVCRTQPAVSQSIKKLEDEVGAPLFARDVHEVSLTEAGRVLADYARRMVGLRDEAMRQVSELKSLKAGTLAIAAHESAAVYLLPAPLRTYLQRFPDIRVGIYRSRLNEIPRQVMTARSTSASSRTSRHFTSSSRSRCTRTRCCASPHRTIRSRLELT
jgi:DNA-binding transcriptional LysR family regulator